MFGYFGVHRTISLQALVTAAIASPKNSATLLPPQGRGCGSWLRNISTPRAPNEAVQDIVTSAVADAEQCASAKAKMEDFVARRTKTAENKIAQAETQAIADVGAAAAEAAVAAASSILTQSVKGSGSPDDLIAGAVQDVRSKPNRHTQITHENRTEHRGWLFRMA